MLLASSFLVVYVLATMVLVMVALVLFYCDYGCSVQTWFIGDVLVSISEVPIHLVQLVLGCIVL